MPFLTHTVDEDVGEQALGTPADLTTSPHMYEPPSQGTPTCFK